MGTQEGTGGYVMRGDGEGMEEGEVRKKGKGGVSEGEEWKEGKMGRK